MYRSLSFQKVFLSKHIYVVLYCRFACTGSLCKNICHELQMCVYPLHAYFYSTLRIFYFRKAAHPHFGPWVHVFTAEFTHWSRSVLRSGRLLHPCMGNTRCIPYRPLGSSWAPIIHNSVNFLWLIKEKNNPAWRKFIYFSDSCRHILLLKTAEMSYMQVVLVGHRVLDVLWPSVYHHWCEIWETLDSRSVRY